jgi:integrase/recombinase XerD
MNDFTSNLKPLIEDFLEFKHALGIKYDTGRFYLEQLDKYNACHTNEVVLTREIAEGWAKQHAEKSVTGDRSWVSPIREFGRYLYSIGYEDAYILDDRYKIQKYHAEVYLLTENEIKIFFEECDRFVLRHKTKGRPYTLPALYRFLYCCGVRCREARNLKCSDVHLDKGYVDIIQSKAHRDRRLYLSDELIDYFKKYDTAINNCFPEREYFFPGGAGGICSSTAVSANFRNIWLSAGLKRDGKAKPRAYDFSYPYINKIRTFFKGHNY